jgi:hypothetical protein
VGLTVINARRILNRCGRLVVTVPETFEASTEAFGSSIESP